MKKKEEEPQKWEISGDFEEVRSKVMKGLESLTEVEDLHLMERAWDLVVFCQKQRYINDHIDLLTADEVELWKGMIWLSTDEALRLIKEREKAQKKRTA